MAKRRTNGKAKASASPAAKKEQATSNDETTKVIGKAKVSKSISAKKPAKRHGIMAKALQTVEAKQYVVDDGTNANNISEAALARKWKNYFDMLPLEMTERIGSFLDDGEDASDKNLVNFAMVCRSTRNAIIHCKSPVWRERFSKRYEMVPGYSALELRKEYQERQMIIRKDTEVVAGKTDEELEVVNLLKKLIIEAFTGGASNAPHSKNMARISQIARKSRILDNIHRYIINDDRKIVKSFQYFSITKLEVQAVQLALCHMFFRTSAPQPYAFQFSQMAAYGHPVDHPMLVDGQLNIEYLLFIVNFFQYHMSSNGWRGLQSQIDASKLGTPKGWTQQLQNGLTKLGTEWNCAYAHMHHTDVIVPLLRYGATPANGDFYHDSISTDTLALNFSHPLPPFPPLFQSHLRALRPTTPPPQRGIEYHQFSSHPARGTCHQLTTGILHPLAPQQGIPGFQRITWMSTPDNGNYRDESDFLQQAAGRGTVHQMRGKMIGYEGVVLPGGKIVLGRWWDAKQTPVAEVMEGVVGGSFRYERADLGPFLFWAKE